MKKWIITIVFVLFILTVATPQNVPNRGFEQWTTHQLFEQPQSWFTSNVMGVFSGDTALAVRKTGDAVSGSFALYMQNQEYDSTITPGFVFCEGHAEGDYPDLKFIGGFPYTERPDSLTGYFKYNIQPGDTALILIVFKKNSEVISESWFSLTGQQSGYQRMAFKLDTIPGVPDTALVGLSSGKPWAPVSGSYVFVDHLQFDKGTQTIPNGDFDSWEMLSYEDPQGWQSGNWASVLTGSEMMCTPTGDAHSGNYALLLKTVYLDFADQNIGIVASGKLDVEQISGGFPYDEVPTVISGYYKYLPAGSDSAQVVVICSKWNEETGSRDNRIRIFSLPPVPEYTFFSDTLSLGDIEVDTVNIVLLSGQVFTGNGNIQAGSLLYVDDLWLESKCSYADTSGVFAFHDTMLCTGDTIILDAGSGYSAYLWSDSSTTQTIRVSDSGTYFVTVMDTGGCTLTDSVSVYVDPCTRAEQVRESTPDFRVYPNPFRENFVLEIPAGVNGLLEISVTNILGQEVLERKVYAATADRLQIDLHNRPKGLYLVRIRSDNGSRVLKVIKR